MCAPMLGMAVGIMSSVAQFQAQSQQAAMQEATYQANKQNAEHAMRINYAQLGLRQIQEGEKVTQESQKAAIDVARAKAKFRNNAAEANVTGLSVENVVADIGRQGAFEDASRKYNYQSTISQLQKEKEAKQAEAHGRILSVPRGQKPSPLTLVAGIGSSLIKGLG